VNRLIGDQQPGATQYTFTVFHPYKANSHLLPSGLLGPVQIVSVAKQSVFKFSFRHNAMEGPAINTRLYLWRSTLADCKS
jgi:hypothetical protein